MSASRTDSSGGEFDVRGLMFDVKASRENQKEELGTRSGTGADV
jgi:hypothetical protein